jgi:hypothetical protein
MINLETRQVEVLNTTQLIIIPVFHFYNYMTQGEFFQV